jgi:hypothetical protein
MTSIPASMPRWQRQGDDFHFEWSDENVACTVSRLHESHGDLFGEIRFTGRNGEHIHLAKLNLLTARRDDLVRHLNRHSDRIAWHEVLEQVWCCRRPGARTAPSVSRRTVAPPSHNPKQDRLYGGRHNEYGLRSMMT